MIKRCHIFVSGRVQGVFYRDFTIRNALDLGLNGWVRNTSDGKVEIIAEGDEINLNELIKRLRKGPMFAKVENLEITWEKIIGEEGFEIRY